jgi:hypothetical protein
MPNLVFSLPVATDDTNSHVLQTFDILSHLEGRRSLKQYDGSFDSTRQINWLAVEEE